MTRSLPLGPVDWHADVGPQPDAPALSGPDGTLALDPLAARAGALLRSAVLDGPGGLPPADRDLVALVVARVLGCAWTAGTHAPRLAAATGDPGLAARLLTEGRPDEATPADARREAIIAFAERLSQTPPHVGAADISALRHAGIDDHQIMDILNVAALTAASARLALALGHTG